MQNTESTPLSGAAGQATTNSAVKKARDMAANVLTRENADKATAFVADKAQALQTMASEGDMSIRLLALVGGLGMTVTSAMDILRHFLSLHFLSAIIDVYVFMFGLLVIALEGGVNQLSIPRHLERKIRKYAYFLHFVWGRGLLYFFVGTLQASQLSLVDLIMGGFMCFVGIAYIIVGLQSEKKLSQLRKNRYNDRQLHEKFNAVDVEETGTIDIIQFKTLVNSLGIEFSKRETETAFIQMDKEDESRVTFEEFKYWWTSLAKFDSSQNSQFAMSV